MKRKRRTKAEILAAQSEGLGDTVEKVLRIVTGKQYIVTGKQIGRAHV